MTLTDKTEALLPCPFCGGAPSTLRQNGAVQATCDNFDCPAFDVFAPIAAWNRRAAIPARGVGVKPDIAEIEASGKRWHGEDHRVVAVRWEPYKPDGARQMKAKGRWQEQVGTGDYWRWQNCDRPQFLAALEPAPTDAAHLNGPAEAVTLPSTTQPCTWPTCGCTAKGQFCEAPVRWFPQPAPTERPSATVSADGGIRVMRGDAASVVEAATILRDKLLVLVPLEPAPAAQVREAAIRECADALRKVIDYAAFAGADPDEVDDEAINSYADYLLTLIDKPHDQRQRT